MRFFTQSSRAQAAPSSAAVAAAPTSEASPARRAAVIGAGLLTCAALLLAQFNTATPAFAHDELVGTEFDVDTTNGSIDGVTMHFSNSIMDVGTEFVVTGPTGASVTDGSPVIDGPSVTQPLEADLGAGTYLGAWRVVSSDGHPIEGGFAFEVPEDAQGEQFPEILTGAAAAELVAESSSADDAASPAAEEHEDHGDHDAAAAVSDSGASPWLAVAISVGGIAVVIVVIAALTVGRRNRANGMNGTAGSQKGDRS